MISLSLAFGRTSGAIYILFMCPYTNFRPRSSTLQHPEFCGFSMETLSLFGQKLRQVLEIPLIFDDCLGIEVQSVGLSLLEY